MEFREGGLDGRVPEDGVFYNPEQELNRDVTIAALRAYREREPRAETYLDAMAASGVRGVRAAADDWTVTLCDRDEQALKCCRENLDRNGLAGELTQRDVNAVLHETFFDVVDLDPFGSPVPFADAAFQGTRNLLCVTATDTAPLCGAHFQAGVRRYSAVPRNTEYHAEMGVRVLLSALVRTGARYDVAPRPLLTHASDHYVRTYLELDRGAGVSNDAVDQLGHVHHCQACLWRDARTGLVADPPAACPNCGEALQTAGPLWLGPTCETPFVRRVHEHVPPEFTTAARAESLLDRLANELAVPTHYDQHRLCKRWNRPAGPMDEFLATLEAAGHRVSRTHYGGTTFKTDTDVASIRAATD